MPRRRHDPHAFHGRSTLRPIATTTKAIWTVESIPRADPSNDSDVDIIVTGHQWWWEVDHVGKGIVSAGEIHIPTGRRLRVEVRSADVVHSFWVPRLARKIDAIPGWINHVSLEANEPGVFQGRCAEFCGAQHARMGFQVVAHDPEDYDRG